MEISGPVARHGGPNAMMHQELLRHFWIFGRDQVYRAEDSKGAHGHIVGMSNGDCDLRKAFRSDVDG